MSDGIILNLSLWQICFLFMWAVILTNWFFIATDKDFERIVCNKIDAFNAASVFFMILTVCFWFIGI